MSLDVFLALLVFSFVASVTPGPNNIMLLASGVNFGFRRTIPHMLGIFAGFLALLVGIALGIGALLESVPGLHMVLKVAGGLYLLWLAWKIATARSMKSADAGARPMTFLEAAAFQWVNPKAWVISLAAMAAYTDPTRYALSALIVCVAFSIVNLPSVSVWAGFGSVLQHWLADPVRLKWFNIAMGLLLALSLWPMLR